MAEKKTAKKKAKEKPVKKEPAKKTKAGKTTKTKAKSAKSKTKSKQEFSGDMGIVIVDDDITVDQEKINEERRAYLEEARSQEAFD